MFEQRPLVIDPGVLGRVLTRLGEVAGGVVVFDLDSTVIDNRPRLARILREFGAAHGVPALLGARPEHWVDWSLTDALRRAGLGAEEVAALAGTAKEFWRARFFSSDYCREDAEQPGAVAFVAEVAAAGGYVAYCTGRPETMRDGTLDNFGRLGLPLPGERVALLMKPVGELGDDEWKHEACVRLRSLGPIVAAFDNEPAHVNVYRRAFPDALTVHLATNDSGRPVTLDDGVISIRGWRR